MDRSTLEIAQVSTSASTMRRRRRWLLRQAAAAATAGVKLPAFFAIGGGMCLHALAF